MKNYRFLKIYSCVIFLFFSYILLSIFLIPSQGIVVDDDKEYNKDTNIIIDTNNKYKDDDIEINITKIREYDTNIYIADITISSIEYLKTAFAKNMYGKNIKETTSTIANNNNAILAINGDYYGFRTKGFVLRNGVIYRDTSNNNEDLVVNSDGSFEIVNENSTNLNAVLVNGALQVFSFGPVLINNGEIVVNEDTEVDMSKASNPRTAIGIIDNLHYVFVVSDGRTDDNKGLTLYELASIVEDFGCTTLYNLDGGGSTTMYFNGKIVNNPTDGRSDGERKVSDIVYVGY